MFFNAVDNLALLCRIHRFYAYHAFMEDKTGTLEAGNLSDLTVLDRNLLQIPPEQLRGTKVLMAICDGCILYTANDRHCGSIWTPDPLNGLPFATASARLLLPTVGVGVKELWSF